jgi:hypothetical protein
MMSKSAAGFTMLVGALLVAGVAYTVGQTAGRGAAEATARPPVAQPAQSSAPFVPPLREFIPIPGPGDQQPGQRPGQQSGECEPIILFYHNGQLYQLRPGQGPENGPGRPGSPPEFFYMNPYQGPGIPGLPVPQPDRGPGFSPVNPRS